MLTRQITIDAVGQPEQVIVASPSCRRIVIYENGQVGTQDYTVKGPGAADVALTRPAGAKTEIYPRNSGIFQLGELALYVATVAGSFVLCIEEQD